jgi:hypothetical protein
MRTQISFQSRKYIQTPQKILLHGKTWSSSSVINSLEGQFLQKMFFHNTRKKISLCPEDMRVISAIYFYVVFWLCSETSYSLNTLELTKDNFKLAQVVKILAFVRSVTSSSFNPDTWINYMTNFFHGFPEPLQVHTSTLPHIWQI